ncbi:O antigen polymerase Wzy, partial [Escherichia coli 5412]
MKSAA